MCTIDTHRRNVTEIKKYIEVVKKRDRMWERESVRVEGWSGVK